MKWWQYSDDLGDGTSTARRFRTQEEAEAAREWEDRDGSYFQCDGDGSPVEEVDTDSKYFFSSFEEMKANDE